MRATGITYDTGFIATGRAGISTLEPFDPETVRREMRIIRDDLHCTAVRLTGGDPERLEIAAGFAADAGLEVWFSPFPCDLTPDELVEMLADCAERAERLRLRAAQEVVFVTGAELTLVTKGFLPGETFIDRMALLSQPHLLREALAGVPARLSDLLAKAVEVVRARFGGRITYASLPTERVDWSLFDFVAADAYKSAAVADAYPGGLRALAAHGKPVAITEFGCGTYRGAADDGGHGALVVEWTGPLEGRLNGDYVRDETEQVAYLRDSLEIFEAEGIDTAFWCTFACYHLPHHTEPADDLDKGSFGVVKVLKGQRGETYPDMPWEPKPVFAAMADAYS